MDGKEADALGPLPSADAPQAAADAEALSSWASQLRSQVVDVNRSSKGSPTGGVARFSAMVVSGNAAGVLGLGVGRGAEVSDAVRKATRAAVAAAARSGGGIGGGGGGGFGGGGGGGGGLFFVPRAARASPLARSEAWFGGVKATVFPLPTGRGLRASPLAAGICRLAGLTDAGVKFHGSRTRRHMVKALVRALEQGPTLADSTRRAAGAAAAAEAAGVAASPRRALASPRAGPLPASDAEWRAALTPEAYRVLRKHGTERPGSSPLNKEKRAGTFCCAGCGAPLFPSATKFDSGTGWPSFNAPLPGAVEEEADRSIPFMPRTEARAGLGGLRVSGATALAGTKPRAAHPRASARPATPSNTVPHPCSLRCTAPRARATWGTSSPTAPARRGCGTA